MPGQRVILTYKDYEVLPADGRRYELHEGELSVTPAPSPQHQRIVDPEARTIEAYGLSEGGYQLAARVAGREPVSLPPFSDLAFAPATLWP